ncbi:type VI secretion system protein TssL, long form [Photobacterium chitinilyticum]|uniref:Type VI secretion system protein TssL n=1 Tax=Photobacterium chitinilyticum TaxID=2485123 RepID=A0A3S3RJR4_9GAMM|nr:type VI secretion system protein TssL, long form [Photobacterium chitinilyticum]RWX57228.1 type VI secretion system protein TssL [Photobacterium chitinilyticum]
MSEATFIKPRPGGRGKTAEAKNAAKPDHAHTAEQTVVLTKIKTGNQFSGLMPLGDNPLIEEAGSLLSLVGQIRSTADHSDVSFFQQCCIDLVHDYEARLRHLSIASEKTEAARYCICSFIDETVLNTVWGEQSNWSTESLLSTFHAETFGGEYFYTLLDSALTEPQANSQLLELQYLCLSLGFVGKMRVEERGIEKLETYREKIYQALLSLQGEVETDLSPAWSASVIHGTEPKNGIPLWVLVSVIAAMTLAIYMAFSYTINTQSNLTFNAINTLVRWEPKEAIAQPSSAPDSLYLQQLLQSEVERGVLELVELPDRVRVIIKSSELFLSGSAEVQEALIPLLSKVARTLESTRGRILITGHTDDQPIFTSRYPSNWHLSLARATAVANSMALGTDLHGRLWPEGLGDSKPRKPNDSPDNRASNRRVEIDLLYLQ